MSDESTPVDLALVPGGPSHHIARRIGLAHPSLSRRLLKVGLVMLVTWSPLLVLTLIAGHAFGEIVKTPLLYDPDVYGRFLFALPAMELGAVVVAGSVAVQMRHFLELGILLEPDRPRFRAAQTEAIQLRDSVLAEALVLIGAIALPVAVRLNYVFGEDASNWECVGRVITPAGWWYTLVSLPVLYFFLLRRVWVLLVWGWFLFRISRLDLQLTPTHPDRAGGLGFVGQGLASFVFLVLAVSAIVSAGLADEILNRGESLDSLKYHVALFVVILLVVLHLPLFAFSTRLARCRTRGLLEFGALAWRHDRAFDEKWCGKARFEQGESLLGSADVQSLSSVAACYDHVDRMWMIPMDLKSSLVLLVAALVPMVPLLGTAIPLKEILWKLGELLI